MRLADFIETHAEPLLTDWMTAAAPDALALRDRAPRILGAIAKDLRQGQGAEHTAAEVQAALRAHGGLPMPRLVSDYRALRTSVLRRWSEAGHVLAEATAAQDVLRFNEAVDQALAESVDFFCQELEQNRQAREAADRDLALQRSRLDYATRLSRVGFWYCDLPFDVLEWDERVKEHFFFPPTARITIQDFYDRIHPEDREMTRLAIQASIDDRSAYDIVYRTRHPDTGQVKWIRALGGTDYDSDGSPIHFDGVTVDVSEERREAQRMEQSEARHRGVLSNMEESFALFDEHFNMIEVNEAACQLVGLARSEFVGANHWEKFPGTYDSDLGRMYRAVLADGKPRSLEHRYTFEDGRVCWLEARSFFVGPGVAVLFRDVTERREMIEALREADRRKDEFLAMLAHELRNPLAPIATAAEILALKPDVPAQVASATAIIRRQSRHLTRLLEDLLDVSRITQGRIQLQRAPVDMAAVAAQAVEMCQSQVQAKQQRLAVSIDDAAALWVEGDFERLVQCVANVLTNATKYTDAHGEIRLSLGANAGDVVVEIADNGHGISADLLPRVFDLFVQSRRTLDRSQGGLGVGLAVVKRLVEMHSGSVDAASAGEGQGATFTLRLPRAAAGIATPAGPAASPGGSRRVLVVDDNADAADTLLAFLEIEGYACAVEHTARAALERIAAFAPDVVLVDIGLPDIDGYQLARTLRASPAHAPLGLIAVTGYGQPEDRDRALQAGFDAHLVKPVDMDRLHQAIHDVATLRGARRA